MVEPERTQPIGEQGFTTAAAPVGSPVWPCQNANALRGTRTG